MAGVKCMSTNYNVVYTSTVVNVVTHVMLVGGARESMQEWQSGSCRARLSEC